MTFEPPRTASMAAMLPKRQIAEHIAIILHDFSTGGTERIAIRLANRWVAMGRRVTLICGTERGAARALVGPGVQVVICAPETKRSPWSRAQLGWRMAHLVRKHAPDIVFSPGNFHMIILAFLARRPFGLRPVFISKLSNPVRRAGFRKHVERFADAAVRFAAAPVDALIAMSPALGREARSIFTGKKIVEIAEPILDDDPRPHSIVVEKGEGPLIVCAARLAPQKDLMTTIRAFAKLPTALNARLLILGEGPLRPQLEREVKRLNMSNRVNMPGHVPDIAPYLAAADLYLMTSHYEGYPAVLVEAMAAGVPIVTTNCSAALPEIIASPDLGRIVEGDDPQDIASAIVARLSEPRPSVQSTHEVTSQHRLSCSADAYLALFDQLVEEASLQSKTHQPLWTA
jgi:glycosyltransferase involved in cell wall biosynthesis